MQQYDVQKIERDQLIVDNLIFRGGYSKPNIKDILWIQLILSPYYLVQYIIWFGRWVWKFWIDQAVPQNYVVFPTTWYLQGI